MAGIPLICTVDVDPPVIDNLLNESYKVDNPIRDHWKLLKSPDDPIPDTKLVPPVQAFKTGFKDQSLQELGDWIKAKMKSDNVRFSSLLSEPFTVLDERGAEEGNVLLCHTWSDDDPNDPGGEWITWMASVRVEFIYARQIAELIWSHWELYYDKDSPYGQVDENGVLRVPKDQIKFKADSDASQ